MLPQRSVVCAKKDDAARAAHVEWRGGVSERVLNDGYDAGGGNGRLGEQVVVRVAGGYCGEERDGGCHVS